MSTKECAGFFLFCLNFELCAKIIKTGFYILVFYIFISDSRSKQNKKHPKQPFLDIIKKETCAKFQQKILHSMVVEARQSFQFFRQKKLFSWK